MDTVLLFVISVLITYLIECGPVLLFRLLLKRPIEKRVIRYIISIVFVATVHFIFVQLGWFAERNTIPFIPVLLDIYILGKNNRETEEGEHKQMENNEAAVDETEQMKSTGSSIEIVKSVATCDCEEPETSNINKCSRCGYENDYDAIFCEKCGQRLTDDKEHAYQESNKTDIIPEEVKALPILTHDSEDMSDAVNKDSASFYNECIFEFHKIAMKQGKATKGLIYIPELIPIGEKTILAFLNDLFFKYQFGSNPTQYYYVITGLSIQAGVVFGTMWHEDYDRLKNGFVDEIIEKGPAEDAEKILSHEFGMNKNDGNEFYSSIFDKWLELHKPYWELEDAREYTFNAILAAYQVGISTILEKYGY